MSLQDEIEKMSKEIHTDGYSMSIGELASIYKENDLDIHPEFQRFFRWDIEQKSRLIESILLGIPIPPIFVSQNEKGIWDVIDGLQRLSTIFEFMGILKDENEDLETPSRLEETKFLPSLGGKYWEEDFGDDFLTAVQRRYIKRSKLDIKIIEKNSDSTAKYELFQRLNTGGTDLSPQEIRNCLLVMINKEFYNIIKEMNENSSFQDCIPLTDNSIDKQDDMELVVRFIVARHCDFDRIKNDANIHKFFTDEIVKVAQDKSINFDNEKENFIKTFEFLKNVLGEEVFTKYYEEEDRHKGAVLISSYEAIALGVSKNIEELQNDDKDIVKKKIRDIYKTNEYDENTARGIRPIKRFKNLSNFSLEYFKNED